MSPGPKRGASGCLARDEKRVRTTAPLFELNNQSSITTEVGLKEIVQDPLNK